jgi:hypothetical protein
MFNLTVPEEPLLDKEDLGRKRVSWIYLQVVTHGGAFDGATKRIC